MDNSALKCTFDEKIKKHLIICTKCEQHYMVLERVHKCNVLAPCELNGKKTYLEKYWKDLDIIPDLPSDYVVVFIECDKCEVERRNKGVATKTMCPQCEYSGWYVHDGSRLCPVCVAQNLEKEQAAKQQPIVQPAAEIIEKPRDYLLLKVNTLSTGHAPNTGSCVMVEISGSSPGSADPLKWEVFDKTWYLKDNRTGSSEYMCKYWNDNTNLYEYIKQRAVDTDIAVSNIVRYLKSLSLSADYSWDMSGNDPSWKWLQYLFAKYASTDDQKLLRI